MRIWMVGAAVLLAGVLTPLGTSPKSAAQQPLESPPPEAEDAAAEGEEFEGRYQAALESRDLEAARIQDAQDRFALESQASPDLERDYLISLKSAVSGSALLHAVSDLEAEGEDFSLMAVFVWAARPGDLHPVTGVHKVAELSWEEGVDAAVGRIETRLLDFLTRRINGLTETVLVAEHSAQLEQFQELKSMVVDSGPLLYGFRCECSPRALQLLQERVGKVAYRAIELGTSMEAPIWIEDLLRDKVIESEGRFGRV